MDIVADSNEVLSALIAKGRGLATKKLELLFSDKVKKFSPLLLLDEVIKNKEKMLQKSGLSDTEFDDFAASLKESIHFVNTKEFSDKLAEAKEISPHLKDVVYFALALKLNCPIWSGDKRLKEQSKVKVLNTKELLRELKEDSDDE